MRLKPNQPTPIRRATRHPNAISTLSPVESLRIAHASGRPAHGDAPDGGALLPDAPGGHSHTNPGCTIEKLPNCRLQQGLVKWLRRTPRRMSYPNEKNSEWVETCTSDSVRFLQLSALPTGIADPATPCETV